MSCPRPRTVRKQKGHGWALIGCVALVIAGSLVGWHFWDSRGEVLKPDGGPVVTVMQSFPLDPLLPGGFAR